MIRIVIIDDHPIVRTGLRALLEAEADFSVEAEAEDGRNILYIVQQTRPDVLILDMALPGLNGLEVIHQVRRFAPDLHIVVMSVYSDTAHISQALANGAAGYVLKESDAANIIDAVHAAVAGERYLSPQLSEAAIEAYLLKMREHGVLDHDALTPREREILALVAQGKTRSEVAEYLSISPRTVEVHRANVLRKLGLHNQTDLVRYAMKHGLLSMD